MNPLFQHPYVLNMQYIFVLGLLAACLVLFLLKRKNSSYLISALPLFALTFHQVDEYLLSPLLLGDDYHFLNWAYRSGVDITPNAVVAVNLFGYLGALLVFFFKPTTKLFALIFLFVNSVTLANACFHVGLATAQSDYSPGMISALLLFLPLYIKSITLAAEKMCSVKQMFGISLYGFIAHYILIWIINAI